LLEKIHPKGHWRGEFQLRIGIVSLVKNGREDWGRYLDLEDAKVELIIQCASEFSAETLTMAYELNVKS
jgi:hypothetical protein